MEEHDNARRAREGWQDVVLHVHVLSALDIDHQACGCKALELKTTFVRSASHRSSNCLPYAITCRRSRTVCWCQHLLAGSFAAVPAFSKAHACEWSKGRRRRRMAEAEQRAAKNTNGARAESPRSHLHTVWSLPAPERRVNLAFTIIVVNFTHVRTSVRRIEFHQTETDLQAATLHVVTTSVHSCKSLCPRLNGMRVHEAPASRILP